MIKKQLSFLDDADEARQQLLDSMKEWLSEARKKHENTEWKGVHDEGTFLTSWREYYKLTKDQDAYDFFFERFDACNEWAKHKLKDGYWKKQEVHHGVEHFIIYLNFLYELDPNHAGVQRQLRRAANFIVKGQFFKKPWWDSEKNLFRSLYLGARRSGSDWLNVVEHLRLIRLGWLGLASGGKSELKDFMLRYSKKWATAIKERENLPLFLIPDGENPDKFQKKFNKKYKKIVGAAPHSATTRARSEIYIANGGPGLFLRLFDVTKDRIYLDAAEKIVTPILDQIEYPYAFSLAPYCYKLNILGRLPDLKQICTDIIMKTGLDEMKRAVLNWKPMTIWNKAKYEWLQDTVGMRKDMVGVELYDDNGDRIKLLSNLGTLYMLYKFTENEQILSMAYTIADQIFQLARKWFSDGRSHGCGARTTSAYCVGHGRNWGSGYVSCALRSTLPSDQYEFFLPVF